jgi:hypothetical protein
MSKNVLFFADGTWDNPHDDNSNPMSGPTNVFKLFENLASDDAADTARQSEKERERVLTDAEGSVLQHAKYLHGVGDSESFLAKWLGGALGTGLIARIVHGYTFLSRYYVEGDNIFIIGFSRGAYTARALAGLIAAKGLLDPKKIDLSDEQRAGRLGAAVWFAWRRQRLQGNLDWLGKLEQIAEDVPGFVPLPPPADQLVPVEIAAVAVWETVGALGIPEYNFQQHTRLDSLQFADRTLNLNVKRGFHAVAIDEMRADFTPTLWDTEAPNTHPGRITQVLFVGAHGDVGGGYPETADGSCLSDGPLKWMRAQLAPLGVQFRACVAKPDAKATLHRPWLSGWSLLPPSPRAFPGGLRLSGMVLERLGAGNVPIEDKDEKDLLAPYQPSNLSGYLAGGIAAPGIIVVE